MDLSIVIVNYNTKTKAFACLDSIYRSDLAGVEFEVFLVDNNSSEEIETELKAKFPEVVFIQSGGNLGMGKGNNLGIRQSSGKFVLILNPDTEVKLDSIKIMIEYLKANEAAGLVGPKLLYPDGTQQISCYRFPKLFIPLLRRTFLGRFAKGYVDDYLMKNIDLDKPQAVDWIQGSCLLIKKEVLDRVGLFDERFFMYLEDTDLCKRIASAGFRVVYLPTSEIIHHHGRGSAKTPWYLAPFLNRLSRVHIASWIKYYLKWKSK